MKTKQTLAKESLLPYEWAEQILRYEPETGKLFWKVRDSTFFANDMHDGIAAAKSFNEMNAGKEALKQPTNEGYLFGQVLGKHFRAHRVAWLLYHGKWPDGEIDHINGIRNDNRIENLRDVTSSLNARNQGIKETNTSGVSGVDWMEGRQRWRARITNEGKKKFLGYFKTLEEASAAVDVAKGLYNYTERHGK